MPKDLFDVGGHWIMVEGKEVEVDYQTWAMWFENDANRIIRRDFIYPDTDREIFISTVFLGLDHSFGSGPPLLYETMIFGGIFNQHQWRYHTLKEAIEGHSHAVQMVRQGRPRWLWEKVTVEIPWKISWRVRMWYHILKARALLGIVRRKR